MNNPNYSSMFLHVDLYGHGYTSDISDEVRQALVEAPNKIVHGEWVSACAPYMVAEFFISVAQQVPVDIVAGLALYGTKKTYDTLKQKIKSISDKDPVISLVEISLPKYSINAYYDPRTEAISMSSLLNKMDNLVVSEAKAGKQVARISFPVALGNENTYYCGRLACDPCFSLWGIEYEEGALHDPRVYDEANACFLEDAILCIDATSKA